MCVLRVQRSGTYLPEAEVADFVSKPERTGTSSIMVVFENCVPDTPSSREYSYVSLILTSRIACSMLSLEGYPGTLE